MKNICIHYSKQYTVTKLMKQIHLGAVRTEEGKEISQYNAQKQAILRESITEYEHEMHVHVFDTRMKKLDPQGAVEEMLAEAVGFEPTRAFKGSRV